MLKCLHSSNLSFVTYHIIEFSTLTPKATFPIYCIIMQLSHSENGSRPWFNVHYPLPTMNSKCLISSLVFAQSLGMTSRNCSHVSELVFTASYGWNFNLLHAARNLDQSSGGQNHLVLVWHVRHLNLCV